MTGEQPNEVGRDVSNTHHTALMDSWASGGSSYQGAAAAPAGSKGTSTGGLFGVLLAPWKWFAATGGQAPTHHNAGLDMHMMGTSSGAEAPSVTASRQGSAAVPPSGRATPVNTRSRFASRLKPNEAADDMVRVETPGGNYVLMPHSQMDNQSVLANVGVSERPATWYSLLVFVVYGSWEVALWFVRLGLWWALLPARTAWWFMMLPLRTVVYMTRLITGQL